MTDRLATKIAAKFRDVLAPKIAEAFHADEYVVLVATMVSDGYGGRTVVWEDGSETGFCSLMPQGSSGGLKLASDLVVSESGYKLEILGDSMLTTKNRVRVNGREFDVTEVVRGGRMDGFTVAILEEPEAR